jgi:pilus assembly protein CpaB
MRLRVLLILSLLVVAVGLGALGLKLLAPRELATAAEPAAEPAPPPPQPAPRARILVAARALPPGTLLKDEDLAVREMPQDGVPPAIALDSQREEVRGGLVRRYLEPAQPLMRDDVLRPRDRGFLAAVLNGGHRAASIGVDAVTGTAGLIWPGDQVDVILTQELAAGDAPLGRRVVGETVLADRRVIAVDQTITQGPAAGETGPGRIARTVTLEVTADQAERLAVASRLGRLSLTVRPIEKGLGTEPAPSGPIFGADVSNALSGSLVSEGVRMRVIQGSDVNDVVFR